MIDKNDILEFEDQIPVPCHDYSSSTASCHIITDSREGSRRTNSHFSGGPFNDTCADKYRNPFVNLFTTKFPVESSPKDGKRCSFWPRKPLLTSLREFTACVIAIAALLATIVTLYAYNGRSLPHLSLSVSLNVLLSIYATVMKIAMTSIVATCLGKLTWTWFRRDRPIYDLIAFDRASRSSFGSLHLLWHVGPRQFLVSLGASLAVAMLALDPLMQQLLQYTSCTTVIADKYFTIPVTHSTSPRGVPELAGDSGIWASSYPLASLCPTSDCSMTQEYSTAAFCSSCHDISHLIQIDHYDSMDVTFIPGGPVIYNNSTDTNFTFATVTSTEYTVQILMDIQALYFHNSMVDIVPENVPQCNGSYSGDLWHCRGYGAAECILYPCVNTYTASVSAGSFVEDQTGVYPADFTWGINQGDETNERVDGPNSPFVYNMTEDGQTLLDIDCLDQTQQQALIDMGYTIPTDSDWIWLDSWNGTFDEEHNISFCLYSLDPGVIMPWLRSRFVGDLNFYEISSDNEWVYSKQGPEFLQAAYENVRFDFSDIQGALDNISVSLTNYVRANPLIAPNTAPIAWFNASEAQVLQYDTCLRVEWKWMMFPGSIVALCVLFYILVVIQTGPASTTVWKSLPLTMALHGPFNTISASEWSHTHESCQEDTCSDNTSRTQKSVESVAKRLLIRLDEKSEKFKISENQNREEGTLSARLLAWISSKSRKRSESHWEV